MPCPQNPQFFFWRLPLVGIVDVDDDSSINEEIVSGVDPENKSCSVKSKSIVGPISAIGHTQEEVEQTISDLITKESDLHKCTVCGKLSKDRGNLKRHVEVHIDGLSYQCNLCEKICR